MKVIKSKYYSAYVGSGIIESFDFSAFGASSFVLITDTNVQKIAGHILASNPTLQSAPMHEVVIPAGEQSKNLGKAERLLSYLAQHNVDRQAVILALGGGVVGDLAGFVASIYKRGIGYVQLPTTLLSQVDSSQGGKTAVNLPEGKNLVGTTQFPLAVVADTSLLNSLPKYQLASGLAEVIKYGVTLDSKLFAYMQKNLGNLTHEIIEELTAKAIAVKTKVSDKDPDENEYRKILNYGHTIGHAIEAASHHAVSHGHGVALGMIAEGYISNQLGFLNEKDLEKQNHLIKRLGFSRPPHLNTDELINIMRRDKKAKNGKPYFVLPERIGRVKSVNGQVAFEVEEPIIRQSLEYLNQFVDSTN